MGKRAVILAGGKGTRLKPYTMVFPKPLVPIGDMPILEVIIRQLAAHDFSHVTIAVNHLAELIEAFFKDGKRWSIKIDYSFEPSPLGTMGPLKLIDDLPENFLIMNGDVLTNLDYSAFFEKHVGSSRAFTISGIQRVNKIDYGVLKVDSSSRLSGFKEKPADAYTVSMGVYAANRRTLDSIPEGMPFGFDDLMRRFLADKTEVGVELFDGYWLDIGRGDDYATAIDQFENNKGLFLA